MTLIYNHHAHMGIRLSMPKMHTDQKINCFLIVIVIKEPDIFAAEPRMLIKFGSESLRANQRITLKRSVTCKAYTSTYVQLVDQKFEFASLKQII